MKLDNMKKEELELLSYTDLAKKILEEEQKSLNTPTVFRKICELLELSDEDYANKVGDFYTDLTTDKRFIFLEDGTWDLKDKHKVNIVLDDEDESEEPALDEEEEVIEEQLELDYDSLEEGVDEDDDDVDDEMEDLAIVDDEMEEEEEEN